MKSVYKVFSFSTTIRNPQRNFVFLDCLRKFNGLVFDSINSRLYFEELVKNGIYKLSNIPSKINEKLINDEILNDSEFKELLKLNPQISSEEKINFRIRTQLKALESQGFLIFSGNNNKPIITMTNLAFELINRKSYITDIYSKIMVGLHFGNPTRKSTLNKARVFLNTIFVIDLLKKEWGKLGKEAKGILKYEFKSFVLGMKDCDYKKCVKDILEYRKNYGLKENEGYINDYLFNKLDLNKIKYESLNDYADEVFRKFEMTGLLIARGKFKHIYYDFSNFNYKKIESLLNAYKNYDFKEFSNTEEYINFLDNIKLPWLDNYEVRKEVIKQKAKNLNIKLKDSDFENLNILEESLNQKFYNKALQTAILQSDINELLEELKILASLSNAKSKYDIPEPLRLEYLLALILGKKYGIKELYSNLIYNENGIPLSYAPAGKIDLEYQDFLFEATMIKNRNQQLNSETTSIARHMKESKDKRQEDLRTMLVATYIHWDVALFFKFCAKEFESKIAPITISKFIELIENSPNFIDFQINFDNFVKQLLIEQTQNYIDSINFN
ncbi:hypothetical protein [uncultured Brachyspira sp.]|uniref:hypothetical protein n=1 Tax=uncultured Brachyspira sp. TaxID=221953 RepID=UPI0025871291|nr:hypothetical protein [uncultured Brachyspira sp.]